MKRIDRKLQHLQQLAAVKKFNAKLRQERNDAKARASKVWKENRALRSELDVIQKKQTAKVRAQIKAVQIERATTGGLNHNQSKRQRSQAVVAAAEAIRGLLNNLPDPVSFRECNQDFKDFAFFCFMLEAARGQCTTDQIIIDYELGGASCLLPDAVNVALHVFTKEGSLRHKFWCALIVTWMGCGGPAFATFMYVIGSRELFGSFCPAEALLPAGDMELSIVDLGPFYKHLEQLARARGRRPGDVLSGDSRFVYQRFHSTQGLRLLKEWRDVFCSLVDQWPEDKALHRGLKALGPKGIADHMYQADGMSVLSVKELFTYMEIVLPDVFRCDEFVPFGGGARDGAELVMGHASGMQVQSQTQALLSRAPPLIAEAITSTVSDRIRRLPAAVRRLPGLAMRLRTPRITCLDAEICLCWMHAYVVAQDRNKKPKWGPFAHTKWRSKF